VHSQARSVRDEGRNCLERRAEKGGPKAQAEKRASRKGRAEKSEPRRASREERAERVVTKSQRIRKSGAHSAPVSEFATQFSARPFRRALLGALFSARSSRRPLIRGPGQSKETALSGSRNAAVIYVSVWFIPLMSTSTFHSAPAAACTATSRSRYAAMCR